jgi:hypothetical protein
LGKARCASEKQRFKWRFEGWDGVNGSERVRAGADELELEVVNEVQ